MSWKVIAAKVTGTLHQERSMPSQDHCSYRSQGSFLAIAVADGAGYAASAGEGSKTAAGHYANAMMQWNQKYGGNPNRNGAAALDRACAEAFKEAAQAVTRRCDELKQPLAELATTLVTTTVNQHGASVRQTGDGGIIVIHRSGNLTIPTPPQKGHLANETRFITQEGEPTRGVGATLDPGDIDAIMLFTDGMERLLLDRDGNPHDASAGHLMRWAMQQRKTETASKELEAYLSSSDMVDLILDDAAVCIAVPYSETQ